MGFLLGHDSHGKKFLMGNINFLLANKDANNTEKLNVIVLEKRDHFAVELFFQYKQIKVDTQLGFAYKSECLN